MRQGSSGCDCCLLQLPLLYKGHDSSRKVRPEQDETGTSTSIAVISCKWACLNATRCCLPLQTDPRGSCCKLLVEQGETKGACVNRRESAAPQRCSNAWTRTQCNTSRSYSTASARPAQCGVPPTTKKKAVGYQTETRSLPNKVARGLHFASTRVRSASFTREVGYAQT